MSLITYTTYLQEELEQFGLKDFEVRFSEVDISDNRRRSYSMHLTTHFLINRDEVLEPCVGNFMKRLGKKILKSPYVKGIKGDQEETINMQEEEIQKLRSEVAKYKSHFALAYELAHGKKRVL